MSATHNALRELGRRVSSGSDERESAVLLNASAKCTDFSHTVFASRWNVCRLQLMQSSAQNDAHSRGQTRPRGWSDFPALTFPGTRVTRSSESAELYYSPSCCVCEIAARCDRCERATSDRERGARYSIEPSPIFRSQVCISV